MKKSLYLLLIFLCMDGTAIAQDIPETGAYKTNTTMTGFHGNWQWVNGSDTVKLMLATKKLYYTVTGGFWWDALCGWYKYKKGNTVVVDNYYNAGNIEEPGMLSGGNQSDNISVVVAFLQDIPKNKYGQVTLSLNAAQDRITWKLEPTPGLKVHLPGSPPYSPGFTLPENMVLTKL